MDGADIRGMGDLPKRRSIRMRGYDYANEGAYFLTICTHERQHLFGRIADGVMMPNVLGAIAQRCWDAIPEHMAHVDVGPFVVMPNHVHGIVVIRERARHDAPGINAPGIDAPAGSSATPTAALDNTDVPETGIPVGDAPSTDAHGLRTRARHDAPLPDPRKPPGIPRGALGQIVASYKSAVTRMSHRDGLLPQCTRSPPERSRRVATQLLGPRDPR